MNRMEDYPHNLPELEQRFGTQAACLRYLARLRWPAGFRCPRCQHPKAWAMKAGLWRCASCDYKASVTAGTIFEGTRKPLVLWFRAIWWGHQPEERRQCSDDSQDSGTGQLPDGLGVVAQTATGDGAPRSGPVGRHRGGGRDLCRRRETRQERSRRRREKSLRWSPCNRSHRRGLDESGWGSCPTRRTTASDFLT